MSLIRKKFIIVVVCRANITRSAYLRGYMAQLMKSRYPKLRNRVLILSAGVRANLGSIANDVVQDVARREGFSLKGHRSYPIDARMVGIADVILTMEQVQKTEIRRRFPEARERTFLLTEYLWSGSRMHIQDVADPTGMGAPDYDEFLTLVHQEADRIFRALELDAVPALS